MFTIGEFSRLSHVSARMLRHYDNLGLLRPAHIGKENKYRYYDEVQLPVLHQIEMLKSYGFSLSEVSKLLPLNREGLSKRIHAQRLKLYGELNEKRQAIRRMEDEMIQMEGNGMSIEKYHVVVMDAPEQKVFAVRKVINVSETHALFQQLRKTMEQKGVRRTGAAQLMYLGAKLSYDEMDVEAQAVVGVDGPDIHVIPAGTYAAVTHVGPYEGLKYAYDALGTWLGDHPEYTVCGPCIERYLKDEETAANPDELETGILFPVIRILN